MAYLRRLHLESRVHAAALLNAMGESMGQKDRVAPEAMLMMMGGGGW